MNDLTLHLKDYFGCASSYWPTKSIEKKFVHKITKLNESRSQKFELIETRTSKEGIGP
jgi:hypothetical protein